jgi:hypothetical protein
MYVNDPRFDRAASGCSCVLGVGGAACALDEGALIVLDHAALFRHDQGPTPRQHSKHPTNTSHSFPPPPPLARPPL